MQRFGRSSREDIEIQAEWRPALGLDAAALSTGRQDAHELSPDAAPCASDEKRPHAAVQRENFLYLIRCGIVESVPRRRFLSSS